jgi:exopolyphosphatase/guanosine-5'-triphosphate,3'-diphosphate pyrophosphatase
MGKGNKKGSKKKNSEKARERDFPFRIGCVDTGSNAIRFLAAEFVGPDQFEVLHSERVPVRLGHQVFLTGDLAESSMAGAVEAFVSFRRKIDELGLETFRAVATSAVREASNGFELVGRILEQASIHLEMISGSEEARLVHLAVASRIDLTGGQWILTDLGGGSVEISLVDDMGMLWSESHTMGSVRLLEQLSQAETEAGGFRALLSGYVSTLRIPAPAQYWSPSGFVATGGNIEALANLAAAERDDKGVASLPIQDLSSAMDLLARLSYQERVNRLGLREDRADVILPAAMVYLHLARMAGVDTILVPGVGVKEGLLLDLADDLISHSNHEHRQEQALTKAAVSLGRRFMFDEAHGLQVARLALSLFDQLQNLHGLGEADRRLLLAAGILHDVGGFISKKGHHKHSLYLLSRSELPGLSPTEMLMVANVARYHRRNVPQPTHPEFMRLSEPNRDRAKRLSAILRVADALDRTHRQQVGRVRAVQKNKRVKLELDCGGDCLLERWALDQKKGLFIEVFGRDLSLAHAS